MVPTCIVRSKRVNFMSMHRTKRLHAKFQVSYMVLRLVSFTFSKADEESCSPVNTTTQKHA